MASGTSTLNDMYVLSQNPAFQNRVQASFLLQCNNVAADGWAVPFHRERTSAIAGWLASQANLNSAVLMFSFSSATNQIVIDAATVAAKNYTPLTSANAAAQQALITDTQINNAVSSNINTYIREPA